MASATIQPNSALPNLFAAAIVERMRHHHMSVFVRNSGEIDVMVPEPGIGDRPEHQGEFREGYDEGARRELQSLIRAVPGGREAVADYIRMFPSSRYAEGVMA